MARLLKPGLAQFKWDLTPISLTPISWSEFWQPAEARLQALCDVERLGPLPILGPPDPQRGGYRVPAKAWSPNSASKASSRSRALRFFCPVYFARISSFFMLCSQPTSSVTVTE